MYFLAKTVSLPPVMSPGLNTTDRISQLAAVLAQCSTPVLMAMQSPSVRWYWAPGVSTVNCPDRM